MHGDPFKGAAVALKQGNSVKIICYLSSTVLIPAFFKKKNADFGSHMTFSYVRNKKILSVWKFHAGKKYEK